MAHYHKSRKEDREKLIKLNNYFVSALEHPAWVDFHTNAVTCFNYREGEQWTAAEKAELEKRGQPQTVNNQVKVTIDRMVGQFVKNKARIKYRGRNYPQDTPVSEVLSDAVMFIGQNTALEYEERDMVEDGFTCGFGVLEVYATFNELLKPDIKVRHIDALSIYPDPYSRRYDWNEDGNFLCRAKWMYVSDAQDLYPGYEKQLGSLMQNEYSGMLGLIEDIKKENYIDTNLERIRLVECWYKEKVKETLLIFDDGTTALREDLTEEQLQDYHDRGLRYRETTRLKDTMRVAIFTYGTLLEDQETPHGHNLFPFVPYFMYRKKSGEPYSMILTAIPLQDAINKRESKAVHLLTTNQAVIQENSVRNVDEFASEKARPDGVMVVRNIEQIRLEKNIDLGISQFNLHAEAKNSFRQVTGINPDALGEKSEVRSGVGIARKQMMTEVIIAPVFDNIRRTRRILGNLLLEMIENYWNEEKLFYITDDLNAVKEVSFKKDHLKALKERTFDVIIEDIPDFTTVRQEQFATLAQILPSVIPFGAFWVKTAIELSDIPKKEALIKQIEANSQPPPPDAKFSVALQWSEMTPVEKAAFAMKLGMPELAQAEIQTGVEPAHVVKSKTDLARQELRNRQSQGKSQMDMAKGQMEIVHEREKHQMDMEKARVDLVKTAASALKDKNRSENGEGD